MNGYPTRTERKGEVASAPFAPSDLRAIVRLGSYEGADAQLAAIQSAAIDWVGAFLGNSPTKAAFVSFYDALDGCLHLGVGNVDTASVGVSWLGEDGASVAGAGWTVDDSTNPPCVWAPAGFDPPPLYQRSVSPVKVEYQAGMAANPRAADAVKQALRLVIADLWLTFPSTEPLQKTEMTVRSLLLPHRERNY